MPATIKDFGFVLDAPAKDNFGFVPDAPAVKDFGFLPDEETAQSAPRALNLSKLQVSPVYQPSQFSSGLPPGTNPADNPDWAFTKAVTAPNTGIPAMANKAVGVFGNVARAIPADVAETVAGNEPYYELHNLAAAALGEPLPIDEKLKAASADAPTWATIGKISQGIAGTAPMLVIGGLPVAAQKLALAGFTMQMISSAPKIATALGDELGKPKEQQDSDKITNLVSDAIQTIGFSALGGVALKRGLMPSKAPFQGPLATGEVLQTPKGAMPPVVKESLTVEPPAQVAEAKPVQSDLGKYQAASQQMQSAKPGSPEFMAAWSELEKIKNRNGGMPPSEESAAPKPPAVEPTPTSETKPVTAVEDGIKIAATAIKTPSGMIVYGPTHLPLYDKAVEAGEQKVDSLKSEEGFLTTDGRFVNRDEAYDIAQKSKQFRKAGSGIYKEGELHGRNVRGYTKGDSGIIKPAPAAAPFVKELTTEKPLSEVQTGKDFFVTSKDGKIWIQHPTEPMVQIGQSYKDTPANRTKLLALSKRINSGEMKLPDYTPPIKPTPAAKPVGAGKPTQLTLRDFATAKTHGTELYDSALKRIISTYPDRATAEKAWRDKFGTEPPKNVPFGQFEQPTIPTEPKPVVEKTPLEVLNTAKAVTVTLPEDATMLQVSHKKGVWGTPFDPSTLSKGKKTTNVYMRTDPIAIRGVSIGRSKEVIVSTGDVKIEPIETPAEKRARAIAEFPKEPPSRGPGAGAIGEPGTYSAIQQLADSLEATGKENTPVNERVSAIEAVKVKASDLKDGVKSTLANVLAIRKALWDSYANLSPYTEMKAIVGKWFYANQRADFEAREFGKQIVKAIPDKLRREAITNWIQADGDVVALKERAAASKGSLKRGYELAQNLTPRETEIAQLIREYYDRQLEHGINEGLLKEGLDNYITQVWKKENPITRKLMNDLVNSKLQPNFKFARKRIFDSYFEGEQAGFKPSKDAGFLVANYDQTFNKSLAARALIKDVHEGTATDGRPLVEVSGSGKVVGADDPKPRFIIKPKATPEEIGDYRTLDHPALQGWKFIGKTPDGTPVLLNGELKVHPEIYDKLKNRLSTSWFRQHPVPRTILNVQSTLKQSMMSISGFHQVQENLHALGHRVNPANLEKLDFSEPVTKSLVEHGLQLADFNALAEFGEGLSSGNLVSKIPLLGSKLQAYNDWLFQDNIPRLKLTMAKHALERNKERYADAIKSGKITPDQVLELTASQANHAFGELPYKYWGRNQTLQDVYRTFLLAPDFLEARAGFVGQALKPGGLGAKGLLKNEQIQALALLALTQYVMARIVNQLVDDDPHWEFKNAFRIISGNHAWSLRTVPGDVIHLISDPRGFTFNRLSPVIGRGSIELATGRDYRGVKRDFLNQMGDTLKSGIPISLNHKNGQNILETFGNSLGVQNQRYDAQQNIQQKAADFKSSNNIKVPYETIYNPDDDKFSALRNAIQEGNQKLAQSEFNKLKGIIPSAKIYQHFKMSLNRPLTGSKANDAKFYNGLNEVGKREYNMAKDLQKSRLAMALSLKTDSSETYEEPSATTGGVMNESYQGYIAPSTTNRTAVTRQSNANGKPRSNRQRALDAAAAQRK